MDKIKNLAQNKSIAKNSRLASLTPFSDAQGILRVGGRLQNAPLSWSQKFPIALHHHSKLAKLIILYKHNTYLHAGPQLTRSIIRQDYWILKINSAIRSCILRCHKCIRMKAATQSQIMAALPEARVNPAKVFQNTGVDYAGPIKILVRGGRHKIVSEGYIAVLICLATKAIHLELVSSLKTDDFLAAMNRFIGRRGVPSDMWSDNGTTFTGANAKLQKIYDLLKKQNSDSILPFMQKKNINWHFIPPHAPTFGGLWEAGVKSVKAHIKATIGDTLLTYEQLQTFFIQVEACLNSRPLTVESTDPNEYGALTPGHFLIGGPITAIPNPDLTSIPLNRLKYWEIVQKKTQEFWHRFQRD